MDLTRATELTPDVDALIDECFEYSPWDELQRQAGKAVREMLADCVRVIIVNVPPSPDRNAAIRKLREARMDCNSAITHRGKF